MKDRRNQMPRCCQPKGLNRGLAILKEVTAMLLVAFFDTMNTHFGNSCDDKRYAGGTPAIPGKGQKPEGRYCDFALTPPF